MKIKLSRVSKSYDKASVLSNLSLEMTDGHILAILGPSGSGKTTLLRIIAGLVVPDEGTVEIDGKEIPKDAASLLAHRRSIGILFQLYNLFPHLSALENVMLPLIKAHGFSPREAQDKAFHVLKRFSLLSHAYKMPAELSGGQKQRVALARSIAIQPRLFLFDEPTSALDPEMTAEVLDAIGELKQEMKDFIMVTHHLGFAKKVADNIAFLDHGKVIEMSSVEEFFEAPKTEDVKRFLAKVLKY